MSNKKIIFKTFLPLVSSLALAVIFFGVYNHYIVDKSLVNLKVSLKKLNEVENVEDIKKLKDILDSTFLMEVGRQDLDAATLAKLEFTTQIIDTMSEKSQVEDVKFFLESLVEAKEKKKNPLFRALDGFAANMSVRGRGENERTINREAEKIKKELSLHQGVGLQEKYLDLAKLYVRAKDWGEAFAYLNKILEIDSENAVAQQANFYLGMIYKMQGEFEKSAEIFSQVKGKLSGELAELSHYEEGDSLYRMGKVEQAAEIFEEVFKKDPQSELSQISQFRAGYLQFYDLGKADTSGFKVEPVRPDTGPDTLPTPEKIVADSKIESERLIKAYKVFKQIPDLIPASKFVAQVGRKYNEKGFELLGRGYELWDQGKIKKAEEVFRLSKEQFDLAIELDPKSGLAYSGRSLIFYFLDNTAEALKDALKGKDLSPEDPEVLSNLGIIYAGLGHLEEAISEHEQALEIFPVSDALNYNLGTFYVLKEDYDQASIYLKKAIEINPKSPYAHNNLGYALWYKGKYSEAQSAFKRGLKIDPHYMEARYNLGVIFYSLGQLETAKREFDQVRRVQASYRNTSWYLGEIEKLLSPK